jgi:hypothetical protein
MGPPTRPVPFKSPILVENQNFPNKLIPDISENSRRSSTRRINLKKIIDCDDKKVSKATKTVKKAKEKQIGDSKKKKGLVAAASQSNSDFIKDLTSTKTFEECLDIDLEETDWDNITDISPVERVDLLSADKNYLNNQDSFNQKIENITENIVPKPLPVNSNFESARQIANSVPISHPVSFKLANIIKDIQITRHQLAVLQNQANTGYCNLYNLQNRAGSHNVNNRYRYNNNSTNY